MLVPLPRSALAALAKVFTEHVQNLAKRGKKQVVPEGLYDALIAVVDLLQKMVSTASSVRDRLSTQQPRELNVVPSYSRIIR